MRLLRVRANIVASAVYIDYFIVHHLHHQHRPPHRKTKEMARNVQRGDNNVRNLPSIHLHQLRIGPTCPVQNGLLPCVFHGSGFPRKCCKYGYKEHFQIPTLEKVE